MSNETAQIRNFLTPIYTLADFIGDDEFDERYAKPMAAQAKASVNKIVGELKAIDDSHFTVAEFKKYLMKQDSMGDALYELSPLKIKLAQHNWCKDCKQNQRCEKQYDQSLLQGNALACSNYNGK